MAVSADLRLEVLMDELAEHADKLYLDPLIGEEIVGHLVVTRLVAQHRFGDSVGEIR